MNISNRTVLVVAVAFGGLLLLFFGGGMTGGTMMGGGMMSAGSMGGIVWMWLPALLIVLIGLVFFSILVKNRN